MLTVARVKENNPVKGRCQVPKMGKGKVCCDDSDFALGVVMEIGRHCRRGCCVDEEEG